MTRQELQEEIIVNSSTLIHEDELEILQIYSKKVEVLYQNLLEHNISFKGNFSARRDKNGKVSGTILKLTNNQLKSLLLDYRLFDADKEPINFFSILKLIGRNYQSNQLNIYLKSEKQQWQQAGIFIDFCGLNQRELIYTLLNTQYFHIGSKELRQKAIPIQEKVAPEMEVFLLTSVVHDRTRVLRNIKWIIEPLVNGKSNIRLPKQHVAHLEQIKAKQVEQEKIKAVEEECHKKFEEAKRQQDIFNATYSFDETIISRVRQLIFGWGATAEIVSQEIPELDIADAQGIINNITKKFEK